MRTNSAYINKVFTARQFVVACLLLFSTVGSLMAQNDRQYVIKRVVGPTVHYLSHAGGTLQDATSFSPDCIWYSSNNYNYYFMDGSARMYLKAPLALDGAISVEANPSTQTLNDTYQDFFFYDWDHGLARGVQHFLGNNETCPTEYHSNGQCWQVVWLSCENSTWKMSSMYSYEPTNQSARYLNETTTVHGEELSVTSGGAGNLADFSMNYNESHDLNGTASNITCTYTQAYTHYHINGLVDASHNTNIPEENYYYYNNQLNTTAPESVPFNNVAPSQYSWSISCEGETQYLSFAQNTELLEITGNMPTLYYRVQNNTSSHVLATLTLTVTYSNGEAQVTQTRTATVTVKVPCQHPTVLDDEKVITYVGVTVSWLATADEYVVSWKKTTEETWQSATVGDVTSYTITGLEYATDYQYNVKATCDNVHTPTVYTFTTLAEPGLMVNGSIFGGGRMADVSGKTEVIVINFDGLGTIYGGNDIAGKVLGNNGADGSTIVLGVNSGDAYASYGTTDGTKPFELGSVYGGGNGYYAYNGTSFVAATSDYTEETVAVGASVKEMTQNHRVGEVVWTNNGTAPKVLDFPSITKTNIRVRDNYVKVDTIFGGAKNAFLTAGSGDGSLITVDGGTIMAVFGGNNWGGGQGYGQHHIVVNKTTTNLEPSIENSSTEGYGRVFGIRYLFGGGNKVYGSTTNVEIFGGQCDTIFGGGNEADVYAANLTVNCAMAANSGTAFTYGELYSNAIQSYTGGTITPKDDYGWDGYAGIYNVRTLFGGNNKATFDSKLNQKVPTITLTSGSLGTVYGGGNAGDMWGLSNSNGNGGTLIIEGDLVQYGTHVKMNSPTLLVDYLYGGCQVSNVRYSTWVEVMDGHVGTVYGGCNVSGDVGSTQVNPDAPQFIGGEPNEDYQKVSGGTYVVVSGGTIYKHLFAGGNGYYHCIDASGTYYVDPENPINYTNHNYVGLASPTHNETHVVVNPGALVKGNVYGGGNLACVGFTNNTVGNNPYPQLVGFTSVTIESDQNGLKAQVNGDVYGGGNMANVYGSCSVQVKGGTMTNVYGGNDRLGMMAQITNHVMPELYRVASDGVTSLKDVYSYVGITGNPTINEVYGGGNGDYAYFDNFADAAYYTTHGGVKETVVNCDITNLPIQRNTFVDIGIAGGNANGAHIKTVYGGGDGVTVNGFITLLYNVRSNPIGYSNVKTIFGGNNKGRLDIPADIVLLNGQVDTVYGGCNLEKMNATEFTKTIGGYENIGSYVRLYGSYDPDGPGGHDAITPNVKVTKAIYGGCRLEGVTSNSLVLVEGGNFSDIPIFGGSDISGHVAGWSRVAVTGGTVGNVYGGGNGDYYYSCDQSNDHCSVYSGPEMNEAQLIATNTNGAPTCANSGADILGGQVGVDGTLAGNVFGGGLGQMTSTSGNVIVNIGEAEAASATATPLIYGDIYGGSAFGNVNSSGNTNVSTRVNFLNGTLKKTTINNVPYGGNLYGGGLGRQAGQDITAIEAKVFGKVFVKIGDEAQTDANCFIDLREANVYGCNNLNGTPKDDVRVDVWRTAFSFDDNNIDYSAADGTHPNYAINQVFGGGNLSDYTPSSNEKKITVYVHNCLNTIRRVFAGGNAAAATAVSAVIEGGRMDYVFGGGNGEVTAANIGAGGTHTVVTGGKINHLFGGSNHEGAIAGEMYTEVSGDNQGCPENITEFFGGSNEAALANSKVYSVIKCGAVITDAYGGCNQADITGDVQFDVRGGTITNVFGGSKGDLADLEGDGHQDKAANITGNVTLNLEGGTITNAFGGSNYNGSISGAITVNVVDFGECEFHPTNIYGGGNMTPYTPTPTTVGPVVNVMHINNTTGILGSVYGGAKGATNHPATVTSNPIVNIGYNASTMSGYLNAITDLPGAVTPSIFRVNIQDNVFGGGDVAPVSGNTVVNVYNGAVAHKVVGGGNQADISGNTAVYVRGGDIGTDGTNAGLGKGIYGGCNQSGHVGGNAIVELTGGTIGVSASNTANIHGGGYGQETTVEGNVTVNFGEIIIDNSGDEPVEVHNENLKLYGGLYGGSALGDVNTTDLNNPNPGTITAVNVLNGTIVGAVYGGGLGQQPSSPTANDGIEAKVHGKVYVKVGNPTGDPNSSTYFDSFRGEADLVDCQVFGCNNLNGSPQSSVDVDVYKTHHTPSNEANNHNDDATYAIYQLFGGGNEADYTVGDKKVNVKIHGCSNTIRRAFGGGNAADVYGVEMKLDGGRYQIVFGGGNGEVIPANVGLGGINLGIGGGYIITLFNGSNMQGEVYGYSSSYNYDSGCGSLEVSDYFLGSNQADVLADIDVTISCVDAEFWQYYNLYCGCNLSQVYGNINVTIQGGTFHNVYGGSKGRLADPTANPPIDAYASNILSVTQEIHDAHPELPVGHGGNITLTINGGTIGNLYGGCDQNGDIEGKISITVEEIGGACPLFIGDIYGGGNLTGYAPTKIEFLPTNANALSSPNISILKASQIGGTKPNFGSFEGNVFGGGNRGAVTSNPKVILGKGTEYTTTPVNILGNVYGGGNEGDVNGSTEVVVVPHTHGLSYTNEYLNGTDLKGRAYVYDGAGNTLSTSDNIIGEGLDLRIKAIASVYGWGFNGWTVTQGNGTIVNNNDVNSLFTMGTNDATIIADFQQVATQPFRITLPAHGTHGTITATDGFDAPLEFNNDTIVNISIGAVINITANPAATYMFDHWVISGSGYIANIYGAITTFTMGSDEGGATISAVFVSIPTLTYQANHGQMSVTQGQTQVNSGTAVLPGTVLNISATNPDSGYTFGQWTVTNNGGNVANAVNPNTTFTMGSVAATLTAEFVPTHQVTLAIIGQGTVMATNALGQQVQLGSTPVDIGEGATLTLVAQRAPGYVFAGWTVTGNGSVANANSATTTFTMGTGNGNVVITATFVLEHTLTLNIVGEGTVTATNALGQPVDLTGTVTLGEGAVLNLVAVPEEGYSVSWAATNGTLTQSTGTSTTFTMGTGTGNATITVTFTQP